MHDEPAIHPRGTETISAHELEQRTVQALSEVFYDRERAVQLVINAGVSRTKIPAFTTSLCFWSTTIADANDGTVPGGAMTIVVRALAQYPCNESLSMCLEAMLTRSDERHRETPAQATRRDRNHAKLVPSTSSAKLTGILTHSSVLISLGLGAVFAVQNTTLSVADVTDPAPTFALTYMAESHHQTSPDRNESTRDHRHGDRPNDVLPEQPHEDLQLNPPAQNSPPSQNPKRRRRRRHQKKPQAKTRRQDPSNRERASTTPDRRCLTSACIVAKDDAAAPARIKKELSTRCQLDGDTSIKIDALIGRDGKLHDIRTSHRTSADSCIRIILGKERFLGTTLRPMPRLVLRPARAD